MKSLILCTGSWPGSFLGMYIALSLTYKLNSIAANRFCDITDPGNGVEMKLLIDQ
jgi:hypothetical protein